MINIPSEFDFPSQTNCINQSYYKSNQLLGLKTTDKETAKSLEVGFKLNSKTKDKPLEDLGCIFTAQSQEISKQNADLSTKIDQQLARIQKGLSSICQNQKRSSFDIRSELTPQTMFGRGNNQLIFQENRKNQISNAKKLLENNLIAFQSTNQEFSINTCGNKFIFQSNCSQVQPYNSDFSKKQKKIYQLCKEGKQQSEKQATEPLKRIKPKQLKCNKYSLCEHKVLRKKHKSMKKVVFGQSLLYQSKQQIKLTKNFDNTSILIDDCDSQVQRTNLQHEKTNRIHSKGQLKLLSQHGSFRFLKIMGDQKSTQMMIREVQLRNQQIEKREEYLFKISHQKKHSNIVHMFSKNKIVRDNKKYLQIKLELYQTNLAQYIMENDQSLHLQIQRKIILFQVIKALSFIHENNIYHRDLSPLNIMVGDKLKVGLTNFAFVQAPTNHYSQKNYYQCNSFIRAPEIILNPMRPFDKGADIWALGCIIVFLLKGQLPFMEHSDADILLQIMKFLGKPSKEYLQSIIFKQHRKFLFSDLPLLSMKQFFSCQDQLLLDILTSIFVFESNKRPTAQNLLTNCYFQQLRNEKRFNQLRKLYDIQDLFDFSQHQLQRGKRLQIIPLWYHSK